MPLSSILAVVGMRSEAALLPKEMPVIVSGGDPVRLRLLLRQAPEGLTGVLSFGIAGGLDPSLTCGDLVVATRVRGAAGAWSADLAWAAQLAGRCGARLGMVAGAPAVVGEPARKRLLRAATGAMVVDLETEAAAAFAASRRLPFAALRAVADTAEEVLPHAAAVGLTPDGRPAAGRVALALLRQPRELPALLTVAKRSRVALQALGGARDGLRQACVA
ncbi:phosphorylase family protein [Paracraurococcus lichenis]|uniref:Nucleoside phosphorylase n=1 Tax=Paracraurococcus lichenis TaxID=3064888 RepID=A0ABT9E3R7_9PROT|nr:nucleoside phosphorylase [Paracraurococcus sp. LOR1-02]MDO9710793.1 nucleoside phosphorylase [Paracraurococcus sp. LOR1-02]